VSIIVNNNIINPAISERDKAYAVGDVVFATELSSIYYECVVAGTSGSSAPTWLTDNNTTFTDGTVTWKTNVVNNELAAGSIVDFKSMKLIAYVIAS